MLENLIRNHYVYGTVFERQWIAFDIDSMNDGGFGARTPMRWE
jgi:hypothetical protein